MEDIHEIQFSPIIVGTMRLGKWGAKFNTDQYDTFIRQCLEMGLTTFDHADIYGDYTTEGDFGKVFKEHPSLRQHMEIVTKFGIRMVCENRPNHRIKSYDASREHMIASVENSLRELNTDYLDVLLIHRPDLLLDPDEIAEAVTELQDSGKVKAFGVSNFTPSQFKILNDVTPLCTNQVQASIMHLDPFTDGTFDQCVQEHIPPMIWSPVGGAKFFGADTPRVQRIKAVAQPLCEKYNASLDQILLAWLLRHPATMLPVIGTTKIDRVAKALGALEIEMTRVEWYDLWQASTGQKVD